MYNEKGVFRKNEIPLFSTRKSFLILHYHDHETEKTGIIRV